MHLILQMRGVGDGWRGWHIRYSWSSWTLKLPPSIHSDALPTIVLMPRTRAKKLRVSSTGERKTSVVGIGSANARSAMMVDVAKRALQLVGDMFHSSRADKVSAVFL